MVISPLLPRPIITMTNAQCARNIRRSASRWAAHALEPHARQENLAEAYQRDADQLRYVASLLDSGLVEQAALVAARLDTIVREEIGGKSWDYLQRVLDRG